MRLKTISGAIVWICLLTLPAAGVWAQNAAPTHPAPGLSPTQVVRVQLKALRNNDPKTDAGITVAYRFASPRNRRAAGDRAHFARMIHLGFADMLTATGAKVNVVNHHQKRAALLATLSQSNGNSTHYLFLLSQHSDGPCVGCWLTDGVIPVAFGKSGKSESKPLKPLKPL